jgi:hypothetical protein
MGGADDFDTTATNKPACQRDEPAGNEPRLRRVLIEFGFVYCDD